MASLPIDLQDQMLKAEADIVLRAQQKEAGTLNIKGRGTGITASSLKISAPTGKLKRQIKIGFDGSRKRGNKSTNNGFIAYMNEYGNAHIEARGWIKRANESAADEAVQAAANIYANYIKNS